MNRIEAIESSLRCFACGLLSLVPVVGVPCVLMAFSAYRQSRLPVGEWNPARRYAVAGLICAVLGLLVTLLVMSLGSLAILKAARDELF